MVTPLLSADSAKLQIAEPAEVEYQEATAWYRDRDPRVADRFAAETRRALELASSVKIHFA